MKRFDLVGRVAIVTGGNGGIGLGMAQGLAECGATVVVAGRNPEKNAHAVAELTTTGATVSAIEVDVTDEAACHAMVGETVRRYGRLDILVNNAGRGGLLRPEVITMTQWHDVMNTNLTSAVMCSQAAYPELKRQGGGKIINVASIMANMAGPGLSAYASS